MDYNIISADDHIDLGYLPEDFWSKNMPKSLGDRAPHVEERDGVSLWVCDGKVWGGWRGRHSKGDDAAKPVITALERGGHPFSGERRPAIPELRMEDMERDGVYAQVIYGPVFSINADDQPLRDQCYSAYNDSLEEFCAAAPDRLLGVPMLPPSPESATKELYRLAKMGGWRQANLQIAEVSPKIHDPVWDPFWTAVEEIGLILSFHVAVFSVPKDDPSFGTPASTFVATKEFLTQFMDPFVDLFAWGILERHPKMRVLMAEAGLGWLPWVVQELDHRFDRLYETKAFWDERGGVPLTIKPSELFKRQIFASFQEDDVAIALLPFMGEKNALWASDYPHPDSTWPFSQQRIEDQMAHLPADVRKRLLHDNAADLFGLDY